MLDFERAVDIKNKLITQRQIYKDCPRCGHSIMHLGNDKSGVILTGIPPKITARCFSCRYVCYVDA